MSNTTVTWSFVREDGYGFLDLSKKGAALTAVQFTINKEAGKTKKTRRFALVLPAYSLEDGVKYKIKLTASHADATGISETIIVTNAAPSKGILDVSPISGTALDTKFSLKATEGWSDAVEDLPLQFSFGYFGYDDKEVYLSFFGLDVVKEDIVFSPGNPARNNNLTVFVDAEDAYGAITRQTATISVRPMGNISSEFLKGYKDDIFKSSESGDINKAISDIGVIFQTVESGSKVDKTELLNLKEDLISNLGFKLLKPGGAASGSKSKRTIKKSIIPLTRGGMSLKDSTRIKLADMLLDLEKSGSKGSKRRRRRATDSSTTVEVYTVAQAQTTLELISNLIDPMNYSSTNMQLKSKLLTTSDTSGINLCAGLAVGMAAAVVEDRLLVLRSEKNPFTDVATAFIDIACTACSGSLSKTAKVRLGTTLKDQYSAWKCSSSDDLCSGTCVVTSQQIYNLLSTSAAIDNSTLTNVVDIKMHNPETYAAISVSSLATPVTYHLPVVNVALTNDTYFECKRWDSGSSSWSSSGCVTKQELIVDQGTQYIECQCTELGYTAAFRTDHPPTTPTPSTIATSALTVKIRTVQFALLGDYDTYVTSANEDQFIKNVTQKVATVMNISELRVTNMTLSKGSIIVKFVLLPGPSDTEESLTSTLSLLEVAVKSGNFTLKLSDGTVLKADPTSFTWAVGSDLTTEPEVAPTATTGLTKTEIIIISCVCGAIALIVLILIVVFCWKKKRSGKRQISPASSEGEMIGRQNDVELRNRGHDNATAQRESYTSTKNI